MLRIDADHYRELRCHGEETYPHESCGVLLGRVSAGVRDVRAVLRCENTRADRPRDRYHIDPRDLLRAERIARETRQEILGFYHSHPDHPARPSATDLAEAHWLGCSYVITRVALGRAEATASFLLAGREEEDKRFEDEAIEVAAAEQDRALGGGGAP